MNDKTPKHNQNIITRGVVKTGQTTIYQDGDDGAYQAGWWRGRLDSNNKVRFVTKTIAGDDVVIDRATGLMWAADFNEAGCNNSWQIQWSNAISYADGNGALDFASFDDWRVPSILELITIMNYSEDNPARQQPPFANFPSTSLYFWSSTTVKGNTLAAWTVGQRSGVITAATKTTNLRLQCVRGGL